MVEKEIQGHLVEFYDSIEDLPISQFHKYSKWVLVACGVGDSIADIDAHLGKIIEFLSVDINKAHRELLNMRQCLYMVLNEQDIRQKAVLCLVRSVDGARWEDFSDSGLEKLYGMISGESVRTLSSVATELQERIDQGLLQYFPRIFEDTASKNAVILLKRRALLQADAILNKKDHEGEIKAISNKLLSLKEVKKFYGEENAEVEFDKQFENMCLSLAKEFNGSVKKYTTMEFYAAYERLTKQYEETQKNRRK